MDYRGQRPPRSVRPPGQDQPPQPPTQSPPPSYPAYPAYSQYPDQPATSYRPPYPGAHGEQQRGISFQNTEAGDRHAPLDQNRQRQYSAYQSSPPPMDVEAGYADGRVLRKKSLVRPDREKIDPHHRQWHYRNHAAQMLNEGGEALPSTTGNAPQRGNLRRGKSLLGREEDVHESGLALFKRGTLRRKKSAPRASPSDAPNSEGCLSKMGPGPKDAWYIYCYVATCFVPSFLLHACGIRTPEQQRAWREKIGLLLIILSLMAVVGFITFGFTEVVCGTQPSRFQTGTVDRASVIIHGYDYDFSKFNHPKVGDFSGKTNPCSRQRQPGLVLPCNIYNQYGTSPTNFTNYETGTTCHTSSTARQQLAEMRPVGQVYYTWDNIHNSSRNLAVYESTVLDLGLLNWLTSAEVSYPSIFDEMKHPNGTFNGKDLSMYFLRTNQGSLGKCLQDIVTVGFVDTKSIGCVASQVVLYVSLVFIIGVVGIRFAMALGNFKRETYEERMRRAAEIEQWTDDIYRPAPSQYRPNVQKNGLPKEHKRRTFLPSTSRFTPSDGVLKGVGGRPSTAYGMLEPMPYKRSGTASIYAFAPDNPAYRQSRSSTSLPPPDFEPFGYPLVHTICLVTAYSESVEGLRTTLDSLATTDYPNSHKLIMVIADGMVKGAGNTLTTPEICLTMMKDLVMPVDEVEAHSYVAIADGHKRHNMAKVYAGFYEYDDATVERSKQQRVPIVLVAKVGNPLEATTRSRATVASATRRSSSWRSCRSTSSSTPFGASCCASMPIRRSSRIRLSRMVACMVNDYEIMGLCGETKIANKAETWVTMIQVFEYYISHHLTKAFESMFGGVMYRIKAPKGDGGYWVPVLANPDVVEHYSENIVDTLHKKNLLLLGEDRYLTTLMLKTFPKRKNVFCPQAVCKTVVPDTFRVLLSQRRRWINSTIHNLAELLLVRDLCGTFCFSMQFVVGMELAGTLVLPAAISFTIYLIISAIIPGGPNTTIPLVLLAIVLVFPVFLSSSPHARSRTSAGCLCTSSHASGRGREGLATTMAIGGRVRLVAYRYEAGAEFERERRWKSGTQSRDSTTYDMRSGSPKRPDRNSYSLVSTPEYQNAQPPQFDQSTYESRPTPTAPTPSVSTIAISRSSEDGYNSDVGSQQRLVSPNETEDYGFQTPNSFEARVSRSGGVLRQSTVVESTAGFDEPAIPFATEPEDMQASPNKPVEQTDQRPSSQAPPAQNPNRYSRTFTNLPPGAAPPSQGQGYGY
ncbi:chitin synthase-domain-containing protein [Cerioporus squamosus]|nr:chitin synthase-domain-containing protein [Cerioporus squamosus]